MTEATATLPVPAGLQRAPTDSEIEAIKKQGSQMIAYKDTLRDIERMIDGKEWKAGSSVVKGDSLSPATKHAFAVFCTITGANPITQVDILGGGPYLNAEYWKDKINIDPHHYNFVQRDISPSVEEGLRARAKELRDLAVEIKDANPAKAAELRANAIDKDDEANEIRELRIGYSVPEWAQVVVETTIRRFIKIAPLEKIQSGEITVIEPYLIQVKGCNWAGGRPIQKGKRRDGSFYEYQPDPVGEAEPAKTAFTRSLRRTANMAYSAWANDFNAQIEKAEKAIAAEFEIISEESDGAPAPGEPQAIHTGNGEPEAATEEGAVDLPEAGGISGEQEEPETAPSHSSEEEPVGFDVNDARKKYFAMLREANLTADRKNWQVENYLPESTTEWTEDDYETAFGLLEAIINNGGSAKAEPAQQDLLP